MTGAGIPDELQRELEYVELWTSRRIRSINLGMFRSRERGIGFDFDEHRLYRPGDDIRRIDWNVTARHGTAYIRQTHAERELNVLIALDVSASMSFGSTGESKFRYGLVLAASLLFSALADQVNTGFMVFSDRVLKYWPPTRQRAKAWSALGEIWRMPRPREGTDLAAALRHLSLTLKRTTLVFVISDFIGSEAVFERHDAKLLAAQHDVIAVIVNDPAEMSLPSGRGTVTIQDLESRERMRVALSRQARAAFASGLRDRCERLETAFYRLGVPYVFLQSDDDFLEPLMKVFLQRKTR